jgi:hypothetical protein
MERKPSRDTGTSFLLEEADGGLYPSGGWDPLSKVIRTGQLATSQKKR